MKQARLEGVVAVCLVVLGALAFWGAMRMPMGSLSLPGTGFMPRVLGIALAAVGVCLLVRLWLLARAAGVENAAVIRFGHRDIAIAFLALCGTAALFEPAGLLITSALFLFVMLRTLSSLSWIVSGAAAIGASLAAYLFFVVLLRVPLPGLPFQF